MLYSDQRSRASIPRRRPLDPSLSPSFSTPFAPIWLPNFSIGCQVLSAEPYAWGFTFFLCLSLHTPASPVVQCFSILPPPPHPPTFGLSFCINPGVQGHGFASKFYFLIFSILLYDNVYVQSIGCNQSRPSLFESRPHNTQTAQFVRHKREPCQTFFVVQVCVPRVYRTSCEWSTGQTRRQYARFFNYTGPFCSPALSFSFWEGLLLSLAVSGF